MAGNDQMPRKVGMFLVALTVPWYFVYPGSTRGVAIVHGPAMSPRTKAHITCRNGI